MKKQLAMMFQNQVAHPELEAKSHFLDTLYITMWVLEPAKIYEQNM